MNKNWLIRKNNNKLILFFNGWGMDSSAVSHIASESYDLVEFNDYTTLNFDEQEFSDYAEIYVVAWSLGVWAASHLLNKCTLRLKKAIAINGTLNPIDAKEGIHPTIFEGTLNGWSEKNRTRFMMRMFGGKNEFEANRLKFGNRTIENQKEELKSLFENIQSYNKLHYVFDTAIIGTQDAIFLHQNQLIYWQGKAVCKLIEMSHYPFLYVSNWADIIND